MFPLVWNPYLPLICSPIPDKLTFHGVAVEFDPLFLWHMNVCRATEDPEMLEVGLGLVPSFVGREVVECCCGAAIFEINDCNSDFIPEFPWKLGVFDNGAHSAHNGAVCPLDNAVLVRVVRRRNFVLDSFLLEICINKPFVF